MAYYAIWAVVLMAAEVYRLCLRRVVCLPRQCPLLLALLLYSEWILK